MNAPDDQSPERGPRSRLEAGPADIVNQADILNQADIRNEDGADRPVRLSVPAVLGGERVDRALALLTGVSRAHASRLVAERRVQVDGSPVSSRGRRLRAGEQLEVDLAVSGPAGAGPAGAGPPDGVAAAVLARTTSAVPGMAPPEPDVVFVDNDVIVVDKPAGLVVHPGAGNPEGTLVQQLLRLFPDIAAAGRRGTGPASCSALTKAPRGCSLWLAPRPRERGWSHNYRPGPLNVTTSPWYTASCRPTRDWWMRRSAERQPSGRRWRWSRAVVRRALAIGSSVARLHPSQSPSCPAASRQVGPTRCVLISPPSGTRC